MSVVMRKNKRFCNTKSWHSEHKIYNDFGCRTLYFFYIFFTVLSCMCMQDSNQQLRYVRKWPLINITIKQYRFKMYQATSQLTYSNQIENNFFQLLIYLCSLYRGCMLLNWHLFYLTRWRTMNATTLTLFH